MISLITLFTNFYIQVSLPPWCLLGCGALSAETVACSSKRARLHSGQWALKSQWQGSPCLWEGRVPADVEDDKSVPDLPSSRFLAREVRDLCGKAKLFSRFLCCFP